MIGKTKVEALNISAGHSCLYLLTLPVAMQE